MRTLLRLDHYRNNFGTYAGIYDSIDAIPHTLIPFEGNDTSVPHTQVTEFTAQDHLEDWDAWENGTILRTYYFEPID